MLLLKIIGAWVAVLIAVFGWSYLSERPKYHFEELAAEVGRQLPGGRLISSVKSGDLASPLTWFRPATTTYNFAIPDLPKGRFYVMSLRYDEKEPTIHLIDADCDERSLVWHGLDQPNSAYPARDLWGEPVVAPNGKTYRRIQSRLAAPPEWIRAFCDTDWTNELSSHLWR